MNKALTEEIVLNWVKKTDTPAKRAFSAGDGSLSAGVGANFIGNDTSDPGAQGMNIYSDPKNLPTAVASILNHAQNRANFHPAAQTPEVVASSYTSYITEIDRVPFFSIQRNDRTQQQVHTSNYDQLINNIVGLYDGVTQEDKDKIKNSITELAQSVFSKSSAEEWKNLFSQASLIYKSATDIRLYIYYTTLHMKRTQSGKDGVDDLQEYTVNRVEYKVLQDKIQAYAATLSNLDKKNIDDWMDNATSPQKENYTKCWSQTPYYEIAK